MWSLSLELSSSANERGWISLAKSRPEAVNSAELKRLLQEDFYGSRSFRQVIAEPLFYPCALCRVHDEERIGDRMAQTSRGGFGVGIALQSDGDLDSVCQVHSVMDWATNSRR